MIIYHSRAHRLERPVMTAELGRHEVAVASFTRSCCVHDCGVTRSLGSMFPFEDRATAATSNFEQLSPGNLDDLRFADHGQILLG